MTQDENLALVEGVPFFALIEEDTRRRLADQLTPRVVAYGDAVVEEGDAGDAFYVVVTGRARVVGRNAEGEEVSLGVLGPGDHFGEGALLSGGPRTATVRAADELTLLRLEADAFTQALASHPAVRRSLERWTTDVGIQNFVKQYTALGSLPAHALRGLLSELEEISVRSGTTVVREGEVGDRFFIVRRGVLEAVKRTDGRDRVVGQMGEGEFFGELALLTNAPRAASVVARSDCELFALSKAGFDRALVAAPDFRARLAARAELYRSMATAGGPAKPLDAPEDARANGPAEEASGVAPFRRGRWRRWLRRYPFLRQHDQADCGAASLAMVAAFYGVPVGIARMRELANVDADGASLWSLARAAETIGFHARGLMLGVDGLADLALPAIVHWEGYHYIVLYEVGRRHVMVGDPALSLRRLPPAAAPVLARSGRTPARRETVRPVRMDWRTG